MTSPPSSVQVTYATYRPSGDQTGACSPIPRPVVVRRRGAPRGRSMTHTLSSAVNARRFPSGDGRAPRTCCTVSVESLSWYANVESGPSPTRGPQ